MLLVLYLHLFYSLKNKDKIKKKNNDNEYILVIIILTKGEVLEIGLANGIDVEWQKTKSDNKTSYKTSRHNILDLQYENPILFPFYPDHLPVLQKGNYYLNFNFSLIVSLVFDI